MTLDAHHNIYTAGAHAEHAVPEDAGHGAHLEFFHGAKAIGLQSIVRMNGKKRETRKRRDTSILLVCSLPQHRRRHDACRVARRSVGAGPTSAFGLTLLAA